MSMSGGLFWRLADALGRPSLFHQGSVTESLEQQLDVGFRQYSLHTILEQDVLLQEDVELIELLDPSVLSVGSSSSPGHAPAAAPPAPCFIATPSLCDLSVLMAFVAVLASLQALGDGPGLLALVPWAVALAGFVTLRGTGLWKAACLQRTMRARGAQLERLAQDSRALTGLVRKSLRLVQETEVISRGFTLVSAARPFHRAGHARSQQLLGLRRASYRVLRSAFRACRLATCHMLKSYPTAAQPTGRHGNQRRMQDNHSKFSSFRGTPQLVLVSPHGRSTVGLQAMLVQFCAYCPSGVAVRPSIQVLFQLWVGQSSEFFRRLALLLSPGQECRSAGAEAGAGGVRDVQLTHRAVAEVTAPLCRALSGCLGDLQRSYDFHRYFETQQQQAQGPERARGGRQTCRELSVLHTSVRSLQLHLKALLNEMIILEDELEKLMVARETAEVTCSGYQELQDRLRLLQPHMQASSSCWDDTVAQVDRMLRRATSRPDDSPAGTPETQNAAPLPPPPPRPITLIQDRDPVPEEQELEAYVSDSDSDEEWRGALLDLLSPEERERQRREREESCRVLLELKSVLGMRASEVERQKWKQLLFSDQAALRTEVPTESSEPNRTSDPPDPLGPESGENHHQEEEEEEEEETGQEGADPTPAQTEFCCGQQEQQEQEEEEGGGAPHTQVSSGGAVGTLHFLYDGSSDGEAGPEKNGTEWPMAARIPALSVTDRLTDLHGAAALSFSSALAAQAAARSHAFTSMAEQTFGDEDEDEEEEVTSQPGTRQEEGD
ncbi:hypothetical protein AAFF_G00206110 [Aldrovandia affinis]|uniref:Vezatin n=1 Tax=Aldrovandia affinis TaxID=143900 RepID=A0AAD7W5P9_9TELE|nr:hypothetical protein AAFF_G00206110 [Aldrovandia affinis]